MIQMRRIVSTTLTVVILASIASAASLQLRLEGVKIRVPDLAEAKRFYVDVLGFQVDEEDRRTGSIKLKTNDYKIVLQHSKEARRIVTPGYSHVSMSMRVNDIEATYRSLKAANVRFIKDERRKEGVGHSLQILDPFGNKISMMQITVGPPVKVVEPSVYNCGLYVSDIETALKTYQEKLGFVIRSRAYMPEDMPLGTAEGKFAFMLHLRRTDFPHVENPNMLLMFRAIGADALNDLEKAQIKLRKTKDISVFLMTDTVGVTSEVILDS
jgi:catechol 2,3-dioxygenase-like lactoylglutathione lyase family enzyme